MNPVRLTLTFLQDRFPRFLRPETPEAGLLREAGEAASCVEGSTLADEAENLLQPKEGVNSEETNLAATVTCAMRFVEFAAMAGKSPLGLFSLYCQFDETQEGRRAREVAISFVHTCETLRRARKALS